MFYQRLRQTDNFNFAHATLTRMCKKILTHKPTVFLLTGRHTPCQRQLNRKKFQDAFSRRCCAKKTKNWRNSKRSTFYWNFARSIIDRRLLICHNYKRSQTAFTVLLTFKVSHSILSMIEITATVSENIYYYYSVLRPIH